MSRSNDRGMMLATAGLVFVVALVAMASVARGQTEVWPYDLTTSGEDVFWTSQTAVATDAWLYYGTYEITLLEVTVSYQGMSFGPFDVTDQIDPNDQSGEDDYDGPPPFTIYDDHVRYPDEPDPVTFEADVLMYVDADGYGQIEITNVVLGTAVVDLGWPFGEVETQVETVRVAGTLTATPLYPGDVDGDHDVDLADLSALLAAYETCAGDANYDPAADFDDSGCVDLADLAQLLAYYGWGT